jgi:ABC-2 type transport system permease protein
MFEEARMSAEAQANASATEGVSQAERARLEGSGDRPAQGGTQSAIFALTQRELTAMFYSPIAYVVGFVFLLLTGWIFVEKTLVTGNEASMRSLFEWMAQLLVFALPLLTMRSVADEFATGAIETLMTAPVTDVSVILGKFLGVMIFYLILLAATIPHVILMSIYAEPVGAVVFSGYLGLVLLGGLFISVGIFASACTRHQLLAALIAVAILSLFTFLSSSGVEYADRLWLQRVSAYVSVLGHFSDFSKGIIDSASVIFFLTGTGYFLFLATKVLESRRWR